jgi:hypothetical protein
VAGAGAFCFGTDTTVQASSVARTYPHHPQRSPAHFLHRVPALPAQVEILHHSHERRRNHRGPKTTTVLRDHVSPYTPRTGRDLSSIRKRTVQEVLVRGNRPSSPVNSRGHAFPLAAHALPQGQGISNLDDPCVDNRSPCTMHYTPAGAQCATLRTYDENTVRRGQGSLGTKTALYGSHVPGSVVSSGTTMVGLTQDLYPRVRAGNRRTVAHTTAEPTPQTPQETRTTKFQARSLGYHGEEWCSSDYADALLRSFHGEDPPPLPGMGMGIPPRAPISQEGCSISLVKSGRLKRFAKILREPIPELTNYLHQWQIGTLTSKKADHLWDDPQESDQWPLHAPDISEMHSSLLDEMIRSPNVSQDDKEALSYLWDESKYSHPPQSLREMKSHISQADLATLLSKDLVETCPHTAEVGYVFTVPEPAKRRRRLVHDTLSTNIYTPDPHNPRFRTVDEVQRLVHEGEVAASLDFKCFYYQMGIPSRLRKYFVFTLEGTTYQFKRLPMGFKWSVDIAQAITKFVTANLSTPHVSDVYIDNALLIPQHKTSIDAIVSEFRTFCARYGMTLGEVQVGTQVTHRGMVLDFEAKTVHLKPHFVTKLTDRVARNPGSWGHYRSLISMMLYGVQIMRIPMGKMFHLIKFWGRHFETPPRHQVTLWAAALEEWDRLCPILRSNRAVAVPLHRTTEVILITDAATSSNLVAGILLLPSRQTFTFTKRIHTPMDINCLELLAVVTAFRQFPSILRRRSVLLFTDNTAVFYAVQSMHSRSFFMNALLLDLHELLSATQARVTPIYVPSHLNPADALSREVPLSRGDNSFLDFLRDNTPWSV